MLFTAQTFAGAIYVLVNHGTVNAGYAVIPMASTVACYSVHKPLKSKKDKH